MNEEKIKRKGIKGGRLIGVLVTLLVLVIGVTVGLVLSNRTPRMEAPEVTVAPVASTPTEIPRVTEAPKVTAVPVTSTPTEIPQVTEAPVTPTPTMPPTPTMTPIPTITPTPTEAPQAAETPEVTEIPSVTEVPTATPSPSPTVLPTPTEEPVIPTLPPEEAGFTYSVVEHNTIRLNRVADASVSEVIIPGYIDGNKVVSASPDVFSGCAALTTVRLRADVDPESNLLIELIAAVLPCMQLREVYLPISYEKYLTEDLPLDKVQGIVMTTEGDSIVIRLQTSLLFLTPKLMELMQQYQYFI